MTFAKRDTQIVKGAAITLMFIHHLFFDYVVIDRYGVRFLLLDKEFAIAVAQLSKICVFIFVFLTAYGATKSWMKISAELGNNSPEIERKMRENSIKRFLIIFFGYVFIYVLTYGVAWLSQKTAFPLQNPAELYGTGVGGFFYTMTDFLGLAFLWRSPTLNPEWWYISIAFLIALSLPAFIRWYKKTGFASYLICLLLANWIYALDREGLGHLTALPLGIAFAHHGWFSKISALSPISERIKWSKILNKCLRLGAYAFCFVFFMIFASTNIAFYVGYQLAVPAFILLCLETLSLIPYVSSAFAFLGKHAMNMYLTHTLIMRTFMDQLYAAKYAVFIFALLFGSSLLLSMAIEGAKKIIGYQKMTQYFLAKIQ